MDAISNEMAWHLSVQFGRPAVVGIWPPISPSHLVDGEPPPLFHVGGKQFIAPSVCRKWRAARLSLCCIILAMTRANSTHPLTRDA